MNSKNDPMAAFLGREEELYNFAKRQIIAAGYNYRLVKRPWLRPEPKENMLTRWRFKAMRLAGEGN